MRIINLKKEDILKSYNYCKKLAFEAFHKGNIEKSLYYIQLSSHIAFIFNWIFSDNDLELLLSDISNTLIKPHVNYKIRTGRIAFYDSFSTDNRALTQQYIRVLISLDKEFLYITESSRDNKQGKDIFKELMSYNKAEIFEIQQNIGRIEQIKLINNKIVSYQPDKLFIHINPWSVNAVTAFYSLPKGITKYKINLTDHAFWLGNHCLDYSIEFRSRGCTISKEKRGIKEDQLIVLPYCPIVSDYNFQGFPEECTKDKVVIFSGGSPYKVYGRNGEYFNLVKQLLDENPGVVFLYAGAGDLDPMKRFIKKNKFEDRFILIGNRTDINEVFKHCDIYLGTYPNAGGLMSQYAALNGKPILAYTTPDIDGLVEQFVCHNGTTTITYKDKTKFFEEAKRLINDAGYREQRGKEIKSCMITKEQFKETFAYILKYNKSTYQYQDTPIDFETRFLLNLEIEDKFQNDYKKMMVREFKLKTIYLFPKIFLWFIGNYLFSDQGKDFLSRKLKIKKSYC